MKKNIYTCISLFIAPLIAFVAFQFFIMYPREIKYLKGYVDGKSFYINIQNNNYRPLRMRISVSDGTGSWIVKDIIEKRSVGIVKIGNVQRFVEISDNYGGNVIYDNIVQ